jgi:HNH endonuclease
MSKLAKSRASKGVLLPPAAGGSFTEDQRLEWLQKAVSGFVTKGNANRQYYSVILDKLWPSGHGIPGPHVTELELRAAINVLRKTQGKPDYSDVFRRVRELQGDEGFTSIMKEGVKYQLQSLDTAKKREPRSKPSAKLWSAIKSASGFQCAHCGASEPSVKLTPDHRVPRSRRGSNEEGNWQALCEQCNIQKSSACQGCSLNCYVCPWAYPETYKPLQIDDTNRELIRRQAEKNGKSQSDFLNSLLTKYFNSNS